MGGARPSTGPRLRRAVSDGGAAGATRAPSPLAGEGRGEGAAPPYEGGTPDLLALLDATWAAAERHSLGGWILRRGAGGGSRVSSVWAKGEPDRPLDDAIAATLAQARAWGQPPIFQLSPANGALDARLDALGWTRFDPTRLMFAHAAAVAARGVGGRMVVEVRTPLQIVDDLWREGGVGPARRACMDRVRLPKAILLLRESDRPAALVFVAVAGQAAMLHALHVLPAFRRRGVGAAATAAAAAFALDEGAETLALAVTEANEPAIALYGSLGFRDAGGYRYRRAPD